MAILEKKSRKSEIARKFMMFLKAPSPVDIVIL